MPGETGTPAFSGMLSGETEPFRTKRPTDLYHFFPAASFCSLALMVFFSDPAQRHSGPTDAGWTHFDAMGSFPKLAPQHLQALYKKKLDDGLSATTVISFHNLLYKALEMAVRWHLIARNPCDLVSSPRRKHFEIQPLNIPQIHQFLAAIRGHQQEALLILALATGMLRGELLALKWQDLDLERGCSTGAPQG